MDQIKPLEFQPFPGFKSPHVQTLLACFTPAGKPPPSIPFFVTLEDGDTLCCEVATPDSWKPTDKTIILLHGLGGNHTSSYMVRISRKLYQNGYRAVRVNMRCCGSGQELARLPYHGGVSADVHAVLKALRQQTPLSPFILIGFSLGGNIAIKLAAEIGNNWSELLEGTIAICAPLDLRNTAFLLSQPNNRYYNRYYMYQLEQHGHRWTDKKTFSTIFEFDNHVTAPQWGFKDAYDYYAKCSSYKLLPLIKQPCHILFSEDDPFIDYRSCLKSSYSGNVKVWMTSHGGHMGFFGWTNDEHRYLWLDSLLLKWIKDFET